ncbi:hypothetical protein WMF18_29530 [Sorangium sp. So ce315]|uniref:hypothetical protein n=1 Tax=Sorangium sp. So ce315 TaxID=3133299 RepID=UPI003F62CB3B
MNGSQLVARRPGRHRAPGAARGRGEGGERGEVPRDRVSEGLERDAAGEIRAGLPGAGGARRGDVVGELGGEGDDLRLDALELHGERLELGATT